MRKVVWFLSLMGVFLILFAQTTPEPQSQSEQMEEQMGEPSPQQPETQPQTPEETKPQGGTLELKEGAYTFEMPPKSLDSYYPPVAKRARNYRAYMDTLGRRFYDLMVDINSVDLEVLEDSYVRFKDYYTFVAELVPEWKDRFLLSDVEELGKILGFIKDTTDTTKSAKKDTVLPIGAQRRLNPKVDYIMKKIEYSCKSCHLQEIPKVYFRYYWHTRDMKMNMATFKVKDPLSGKLVPYRDFKSLMANDYYTILRAIDKGSKTELRKNVRDFIKRFNYNQSLCSNCHDEDPYLFTTPTIATLVRDLDNEANKNIPNKDALRRTLYELYRANCTGCHRVHYPATYVQRFWYNELPKPPQEPQIQGTQEQPSQPEQQEQPTE
ncbi:MAG: hypothetical protein ABIL16_02960 [candidate division WOR-3 bacterium]